MTASGRPYAEVIGDPVDHSLSPLIHGFWLEAIEKDADYRATRVQRADLPAYLDKRRQDPLWRGCNVTMPLKLDAIALADSASDTAIGTGAANIIIPREGKLLAGNTDVEGVMTMLRRLHEEGAKFTLVHLLGSGGAARAALMALHLLGVSNIRIHSRDVSEATKLAVQFGLRQQPVAFDAPVSGDGLINATPLGMVGNAELEVDPSGLDPAGWVMEFITAPAQTRLLGRARDRGLKTVDGISILVEQADQSFRHFFDADAPRHRDDSLFERLRQ